MNLLKVQQRGMQKLSLITCLAESRCDRQHSAATHTSHLKTDGLPVPTNYNECTFAKYA
jgi:hypothetical protein